MNRRVAALSILLLATATPVVGQSTAQPLPITAAERRAGDSANAAIVAEYGGPYRGRQAAYVEQVGRRIAVQSGLASNPAAFTVTLLNSPVDNAFAVPGGYVYVTRNLLALMNDEAELAAVLGHEVAHVAARHSSRRQSVATRNSILGMLGQAIVGSVAGNSGLGQLLSRGIGTGTQLATLGFSRAQETEADDLGVSYLARAGYEPAALSTMLIDLAAQNTLAQQLSGSGRAPPAWASTHPDPASRVRRAQAQAAAVAGIQGGDTAHDRGRARFLAAIDGMLYGDDPQQGVVDGRTFIYPPGRIAFTAPQGFTVANSGPAVTIAGPGGQAQFQSGPLTGSLAGYVTDVFNRLGGGSGEPATPAVQVTRVNGIAAAYATVRAQSGETPVDATVFAYAITRARAYHFVVLTPAGSGLGPLEPLIGSFRAMVAADTAAARPRYLRVVTVKPGETQNTLAARMAYRDDPLGRLRVLNGLDTETSLRPGDRVKIVTY